MFPNASESFIASNSSPVPEEAPAERVAFDVDAFYASYLKTGSVHKTGAEFGVSGDTIHHHLKKAGKKLNHSRWTEAEITALKEAYADPAGVCLSILAVSIGRTHAAIACKAEDLGITADRGRQARTAEHNEKLRERLKDQWKTAPHPRGMAGKKHSPETKRLISETNTGRKVPPDQMLRTLKTRVAKYGSLAVNRNGVTWKGGWREIAGRRIYMRSRWEANYGRYLQLLLERGEISKWEHEPETFWFEKIKRGVRSYLPDYRVTHLNGSITYHEVKGWMDNRSKTKLKRMAKYHPSIKLVIIQADWFKANGPKLCGILEGWESDTKRNRGPANPASR